MNVTGCSDGVAATNRSRGVMAHIGSVCRPLWCGQEWWSGLWGL